MESKGIHGHTKATLIIPSISMPSLPDELITEILLKLPVESLLKFRSVSKSWLSLISSSEFAKTHLLLSASNKNYTHHRFMFKISRGARNHGFQDCSLNSFLYNSVTEAFNLDYPLKGCNAYPVGSVNGLICLSVPLSSGLCDLFIWNPSIRKYKKLPDFTLNLSRSPWDDELIVGFAYDVRQDDYKVVGIFPIYEIDRPCHVEVKIYSLKSDSWRRIGDFKGKMLLHCSGKLVNEKLHWLDNGRDIVSIDLADEKWIEIEKPCNFISKLGVFGSDLSLFCNDMSSGVDVWVMKEYGVKESWIKMCTIKVDSGYGLARPLFVSNEGEILFSYESHYMKYNPKDDSIRSRDVTNLAMDFETEVYVKSLVCPFLHKVPRKQQERRLKYGFFLTGCCFPQC